MVWIKICILYETTNALSGKWILMFQQNDNNIFGVIRGVWGGWGAMLVGLFENAGGCMLDPPKVVHF